MAAIEGTAMTMLHSTSRAAAICVGALLVATGCADRPAESGPRPRQALSVRLEVDPDTDSGWNVHLVTRGFRFAPERAGRAPVPGEGHAHLYVDGKKVARVYGPWFHLPAADVPRGPHTLTVALNGNDHTPLTANGRPIRASARITGTNHSGTEDHEHPKTPAPATRIAVRIADGRVVPPPGRVEIGRGRPVRLEVRADTADTIHVHGYDIERPITPGRPTVVEFEADRTGLFEVETHDSGLVLTQLLVR